MTTDKTPATLATVKHGGCVQLGDGLMPCPFCGESLTINGAGDGVHPRDSDCILAQHVVVADHAPHAAAWNRRAQPSPGGKGDALLREVCSQLESLDCGACIGSDAPMEDLHGRIAAHLAARQPVGDEERAETYRKGWEAGNAAQAVDLGQLKRLDMEGVPTSRGLDVCNNLCADGEWVRFDDVKALIDGKAVGK